MQDEWAIQMKKLISRWTYKRRFSVGGIYIRKMYIFWCIHTILSIIWLRKKMKLVQMMSFKRSITNAERLSRGLLCSEVSNSQTAETRRWKIIVLENLSHLLRTQALLILLVFLVVFFTILIRKQGIISMSFLRLLTWFYSRFSKRLILHHI